MPLSASSSWEEIPDNGAQSSLRFWDDTLLWVDSGWSWMGWGTFGLSFFLKTVTVLCSFCYQTRQRFFVESALILHFSD
ncbi:hypothetical protein C0431_13880 [bacterium]|nr:hypothetical protein [bacterium]